MPKFKKHGFSLIELSVVIIIVGIFIAGIMVANSLVKKSRMAVGQALTTNSPVNNIADNALWLESSLDKSFIDSENKNDAALTGWNDIRNSSSSKTSAIGEPPKYSNTINNIHAIKFTGNGGSGGYFNIDASFLNKTDYTIFVLEKRQTANNDNYFIGGSSVTTLNQSLLLGYKSNGSVAHSQSGSAPTNSYNSFVDSYSNYSDKPRIFAFSSDSAGKKLTLTALSQRQILIPPNLAALAL